MKKIFLSCISCLLALLSLEQKGKFDLASYATPAGWEKASSESAIQFTKENAATGAYCMITRVCIQHNEFRRWMDKHCAGRLGGSYKSWDQGIDPLSEQKSR
jgi:hypothetical protein